MKRFRSLCSGRMVAALAVLFATAGPPALVGGLLLGAWHDLAAADAETSPVPTTPGPVVSPWRIEADAAGPIIALDFDPEGYDSLRGREVVTIAGFALPGRGRDEAPGVVDLELQRMSTVTDGSRFVLGDRSAPDGIGAELDLPEVALFRGHVGGWPRSRVFLSIAPGGASHGYILVDGRTVLLSSGTHGMVLPTVIYDMHAIPPGLIRWRDFVCQMDLHGDPPPPAPPVSPAAGAAAVGNVLIDPPCRRLEIAIDTDAALTDVLFDGDLDAAGQYVASLLGAVSEIYSNQVNVEFEVVFVRLWTGEDPWMGGGSQWAQFQEYWNENMTHIERDLAHFLSGTWSGGIARLGVVCSEDEGYALSGVNGLFPYPLQDHHEQNWDLFVVAHEIGHNLGALHTQNYCPPLDKCSTLAGGGPQPCFTDVVCTPGTIMGYCHLSSCGGVANVGLTFHPVIRQIMLEYLETVTECDLAGSDCLPMPEQPALVQVPGDVPTIAAALDLVAPGGEVAVAPGTYSEHLFFTAKPLHLRSTAGPAQTTITESPPFVVGGVMAFLSTGESSVVVEGFTLTGGTGTLVGVDDWIINAGGAVYAHQSNPTFVACTFAGNHAKDGGAMFNRSSSPTLIDCAFDDNGPVWRGGAIYNTESSQPVMQNCLFNDNVAVSVGGAVYSDGSSTAAIATSTFCGNEPDDIAGPWTDEGGNVLLDACPVECPGDLIGDGAIGVDDLLLMLAAWGPCPDAEAAPGSDGECPADLTGDGSVDVDDLLALLAAWGPCP